MLFSEDSQVALDADTGKMKWFVQFTPHDTYDYDATEAAILLTYELDGKQYVTIPSGTALITFALPSAS